MFKNLLLIIPIILSSCVKDYDDLYAELEPVSSPTEQIHIIDLDSKYPLFKESYYNQRSGISFTWHDIQPPIWDYMPNLNNRVSWYNGGHQYGDVNKDGYMDILTSYHLDENNVKLSWFINSGDNKNFTPSEEYFNSSTSGYSAHKILKTDVNNDGIADYIALGVDERVQNDYNGNFTVLVGRDDNRFDVVNIPNPNKYWFHNGAAGDLNGDGNVDVATAQYVWWGDGDGNFVRDETVDLNRFTDSPLVYEIVDINNDTYNDIILRGPFENTTIVFGLSSGIHSNNIVSHIQPNSSFKAVMDLEFVDIDSDGDLDIIELAQRGGNPPDTYDSYYFESRTIVYYNNNMNFTIDEELLSGSLDGSYQYGSEDKYGWSVFKFDDLDDDGIDDIVAENYHDSNYNGLKLIDGKWKKHNFKFGN